MRRINKRAAVVAVTAALALAAGGAAFAFWTTSGYGADKASTGKAKPLIVHQTSELTPLAPDSPTQELKGDFTNKGDGTVRVNGVHAEVAGTSSKECTAADFIVTDPVAVSANVPVGEHVGAWSGGGIAFNNTESDQNACQGVTVYLKYSIN